MRSPLAKLTRLATFHWKRCCSLVFALCISSAIVARAQAPQATAPAPAQPAQHPAAAPAKTPDASKEALVFDELRTRIRDEADGTGTRETTARVRILADAGVKAMAVLTFTYTASNQQMDIAYVRVRKPDGSVVVTPDYNTQDMPAPVTLEAPMYSDLHEKHVAVKGLGVGDTLEYEVTLRTLKPEVPGQFWLEYTFQKNLIVLDEELDLDLPADKQVTVASADVQPAITTSNGRKLYHWSSSNLARPDPDAPPKSTKNWKPSVQVTTFTSWEQVGAWYQSLQHNALTITPAIQARADALTKGLTSPEDKVHAIFDDVALHIHYVGLEFGIGRYQPHPADDVLSNEYGDCKDKHTLLAALLKAAGIEAWPVLIPSSRNLDAATPSPEQFDHVITAVPLNGKLLWMDSTEEVAPIGTLIATLRDKQALAIPPSKPAYLVRTPADLPYLQTARFEVQGSLSDKGVFTGHFVQTYHGDVELVLRAAFRSVPQSQWKELVQRFSNATGFAGEVKTPTVSPIEQLSQPFSIAYDYTREKYGEWDDHRITPPLPPTGWELAPGVKQIKPADDIDIGSPGDQEFHSTVQLPAGWTMYPPAGVDLKEDWAEYHSSYVFKDGTYTADRRMVMKKDKIPLAQWDKYLDFRRAIYADEIRMTALIGPGGPGVAAAALPLTASSFTDINDFRQQIFAAIQPLREVTSTLESDTPPSASDLSKAADRSRKSVDEIEAKTLTLPLDDPHSLYWAQALAFAWCTRGWVALEAHDLNTAESYLRAAWRLSQDQISGYQFGRALQARGDKAAAEHQFRLADITSIGNSLGSYLYSSYNVKTHIADSYKGLSGRTLEAASLNHGDYNGSLRAELDKQTEIHPLTHTSKLTGSGLYTLAFEAGKPVKAAFLNGDQGFSRMTAILEAHRFEPQLPTGSKARLLREVRVVCTPWAGCDAYLFLPTAIQMPAVKVSVQHVEAPGSPKDSKTVRIEIAPPSK